MIVSTDTKVTGSVVARSAALCAALPSMVVLPRVPSARVESDARGVSREERTISAPEMAVVAAAAGVDAYAANANLAGAGHRIFGQRTKFHSMWALRGLDPWSDPT
ncbi:hypothetical protein FH609_000070 [Streptomyces sp. 3MP-14]|uniref:Uncharacterized protein n=1 Tax=Streptomyces mimosae TaxID=2586635 RepID=A0A5N6ASV6_9ACTN|nr:MULTISPECIES: hypothetical protein [Streptomyces]KAB8171182.1 hypothetical protein FH607_002400 [Streptomyces mimosae]KAB8179466.1 hypothetical protein FH609_000070 [Streptomyces sp. 3MP-14]